MPMTEPLNARYTMFKDHDCCVEHRPGIYAVLDRTKIERGDLRVVRTQKSLMRHSRWAVYDLTESYFGDWYEKN